MTDLMLWPGRYFAPDPRLENEPEETDDDDDCLPLLWQVEPEPEENR